MSPFTESQSFDTAFAAEFKRHGVADPTIARLRDEATKIVKQCGHNFDLMTTKLMARTKRDPDLRYAIHEIFIRAIFKEIEPDKVPVRAAVRSRPGTSTNEGDAGQYVVVQSSSETGVPVSPSAAPAPRPRHLPGKRNPADKIAARAALAETTATILTMRKTFDDRFWGDITLHELRARASDGNIAGKLIQLYGSSWQALPTDSKLGTVLTPEQFERAAAAATSSER